MIPYSRQLIGSSEIKAVVKTLKSDFLTQGDNLIKFENVLAKKFNSKYSVGFNSATSALHIACMALGIKKNDIVWTCTNSFVASSNCALYCGAKIELIDIDLETFNISLVELEKKLISAQKKKKLPKLLIPVHFAGLPCDMKKIHNLSRRYGFKILEDASHAVGAKYFSEKIGSCKYSNITVFSFHPVKIITTAEGGAALTNDKQLNEKLKLYRNHGITRNKKFLKNKKFPKWYYEHIGLGFNYRLNEIQSILGIVQLSKLNNWIKKRQKIFSKYSKCLSNLPLVLPKKFKKYESSNHLYVIQTLEKTGNERNKLYNYLKKNKVEPNVHYIPIHTHPFYKKLGFKSLDFPNANLYYKRCLSIPMHAGLHDKDQDKVINLIENFYK